MTYFNLDHDLKDLENNDYCKLYLPPINHLRYFEDVSYKSVKCYRIKKNNEIYLYITLKTVNMLINHFKEINTILDKEIKNNSENCKLYINTLYLKSLFNIYEKNIEILINDVHKFKDLENNLSSKIKKILTHKFKFKNVIYFNKIINIESSFSKLKESESSIYLCYDYITYNDKIQDMIKWKQKNKEIENEKLKIKNNYAILSENQKMYMNDPYILNLKMQCDYPNNLVELMYHTRYTNYTGPFSDGTICSISQYISSIKDILNDTEYPEFEVFEEKYELFKFELKSVVKLFNNRQKSREHFKDNTKKYNYNEIKLQNKNLNQEFKRVYKLISKNIGFNLIS